MPSANGDDQIRGLNVGPFNGKRTQPAFRPNVRDPIPAPVVADHEQVEALSPQRVERVRDGKNFSSNFTTFCSARLFPRGGSNRA